MLKSLSSSYTVMINGMGGKIKFFVGGACKRRVFRKKKILWVWND